MSNGVASYTPVPTEYKGVVYRSKCEAMFARYLELDIDEHMALCEGPFAKDKTFGNGRGGFVYEPWDLEIDGWKPDFLAWSVFCRNDNEYPTVPIISNTIIEYKPSKPTKTYVAGFFKKCFRILNFYKTEYGEDTAYRTSFELYYGSCFNSERGYFATTAITEKSIEFCDSKIDWLVNYEDAIKATRFDLEVQ